MFPEHGNYMRNEEFNELLFSENERTEKENTPLPINTKLHILFPFLPHRWELIILNMNLKSGRIKYEKQSTFYKQSAHSTWIIHIYSIPVFAWTSTCFRK
jgi:hypothetical protein